MRISGRSLSLLVVLLMAGVILAGLAYYHSKEKALAAETTEELATVADLKIAQINQWLNERRADGSAAVKTPSLQKDLQKFFNNPQDPQLRSDIQTWLDALKDAYQYRSLAIFDTQGQMRLTSLTNLPERAEELQEHVQTALQTNAPFLTDIHRLANNELPHLNQLVPLHNPQQEKIGVLLFQMDPNNFLFPMLQKWPTGSDTAETYLLRKEKDSIFFLSPLRHSSNMVISPHLPLDSDPRIIAIQAAKGKIGEAEGLDYRGKEVLAAIRPIKDTPWIMVAKIDRDEVYKPLQTEAVRVTLTVSVTLLALGFGAGWVRRQQNADMLARQLHTERTLLAKDKRLATLMREASDAIIVLDEELKVAEFNERALKLYGYTATEFLHLPVNAFRPPEILSSQKQDLESFSSAKGALYETIHKRKDGTTFPIEISGRSVEVNGKREIIAVVRDITQRKETERHIQQLNRVYAALSGINQSIVHAKSCEELCTDICKILVEEGKFTMSWIGWIDEDTKHIRPATSFGDVTGYTTDLCIFADERPEGRGPSGTAFREERIYVCNDFMTDPNTLPWRKAAEKAGFRSSISLPVRRNGKVCGLLTVYASEPNFFGEKEISLLNEAAGDISFALDNLARDAAAEQTRNALQERDEMLAAIFSQAVDAIILVDAKSKNFVEFNEAAHRNLGYTREEFSHLTVASIDAKFTPEALGRELAEINETGSAVVETIHRHRNGSKRDVRISVQKLVIRGREYLLSVITDITERKRAEVSLRASEERFRQLFRLAPIPMGMSKSNGEVIFINERHQLTFGYTLDDIPTTEAWWQYAYPDPAYRQQLQIEWDKAFAEAQAKKTFLQPIECRITCKDGTVKIVEVSGIDLGEVFVVSFFDLTQRKQTEEALLHEQEFTRAMLENLDAGVVACDNEGNLRLFNRIAREWHGLDGKPVEISEPDWATAYSLFNEDGVTPMQTDQVPLSRALRNEKVRGAALVIARPGFPPRSLLVNASQVLSPDGRTIGAVAVMHDVSDKNATEAQLLLQSTALDAAANAIVITDVRGDIVWVNKAFTRQTGYTKEEALGHNPRLLKSGIQGEDFYRNLWGTVASGKVWQGSLKNRRKDGTIYDEEMTITPVRTATGKITHFIAIKQDITQRKELEKQYLRAQRMEGVGLLAGGIAHDLNNVLAPIMMSVELMRTSELPPDLLSIIETVETSAKRGADIVRQVLTFARGIEGEKGPLQLRHLVKDMVRMATETFPRNLHIKSRMPGDLWPIKADATQIHQVLLNLSVNARDAMPKGGELIFSAHNVTLTAEDALHYPGSTAGDYVRLEVSDTGVGIPSDIQDRIFEPFFTTKEQGKGTGLGLSTVIGIVHGHNGSITVQSSPGNGSTFILLFPALPAAQTNTDINNDTVLPKGRNELILLVDDEPGIISIAESVLRRNGYRVLHAANGADALAIFLQNQKEIALVITDIMMPVMDGVTLVQQLHRLKPDVKCVAASGLMSAKDNPHTDELKALGVRHFLTKPFTVEVLLGTLDEVLHS